MGLKISTDAAPSNRADIWIVIAAFNEGTMISDVVQSVKQRGYPVVVVDDGSGDTTGNVALEAGAHVVSHPINLGQGAALLTGIKYAVRSGARIIVTFDADGQHAADEIERVTDALLEHNVDFALGSRFIGQAVGIPKLRVLTLKAAAMFTWITTGVRLTDAHNGFRAMTRDAATRLEIYQNRMAHASEIVSYIAKHKLRVSEVPVTITYTDYSLRKGQKLSNSVRILVDLFLGRISR
ncbi:glycosyltransferase family 2 protein [Pandoraea soli]|uniref:Lipid A biosynthesis lauroyltransferase n=1 Tax=Pandoraea soli TaxID=2508293 RepID=A0ABY6W9B5_9BURK|nr:glycosyltransferase family 2 protein [Pandoraea soli]VVE32851.1 Lipid A biosynthesis lauroyltransferase [Pandoraea soli]